ncbi:MAG: hypothetical protein ABIF01_04915, partial [Candidatus Micrarchaeota archaeon]
MNGRQISKTNIGNTTDTPGSPLKFAHRTAEKLATREEVEELGKRGTSEALAKLTGIAKDRKNAEDVSKLAVEKIASFKAGPGVSENDKMLQLGHVAKGKETRESAASLALDKIEELGKASSDSRDFAIRVLENIETYAPEPIAAIARQKLGYPEEKQEQPSPATKSKTVVEEKP